MSSLRMQLVAWLLLPLSGILAIYGWSSFDDARATADVIYDNMLLASARGIAEQIHEIEGHIEVSIPPSAIERLSSTERDRVVYRVTGPSLDLLTGNPDVPDPPSNPTGLEPRWFDGTFRGLPIRAVVIAQPVGGEAKRAIVIVGQTRGARDRMVRDLWQRTFWREVLMVSLAMLLALIGLRRGLAPLMRLHDAVKLRDSRSLGRLDIDGVQSELKPIVQTLNAGIDRIERQIEQKRQWIAAAAHQLRNPLSLLRTQAAVGLRSNQSEEKDAALAAVDTTASEMSRLTNQLLTLADVDAAHDASPEIVDLTATVRHALFAVAPRALDRRIGLELIAPKTVCIAGNATLLHEVIINLLDNALSYTPRGGSVAVTLAADEAKAVLTVADSGPGIPPGEREKVLERFYRVPGTAVEGSGLGLAIVSEIVRGHSGTVVLGDRAEGPGLSVAVVLPTSQPERS